MRPEMLALRAANQYRSRDILSYLGLRYYFNNVCAQRDSWAETVSRHLVMTRESPVYFKSCHFKEVSDDGVVQHRFIFLPGPNEIFAETALLAECAKYKEFKSPSCVFSYRLAHSTDTGGVYRPYFEGFSERHAAIARACEENRNSLLLYTDIRSFYPSINGSVVRSAWITACEKSKIATEWKELGCQLIEGYRQVSTESKIGCGLLTGPMFSHLLANLVLQEIDTEMMGLFPNRYFRYVDDVVLLGGKRFVDKGREVLSERLHSLGLNLHALGEGKEFYVSADEWLAGVNDFEDKDGGQWGRLIADIKYLLYVQREGDNTLEASLTAAGFRFPIPKYRMEISQAPWRLKLGMRLNKHKWIRKILQSLDASEVVDRAMKLRFNYISEIKDQLELGSELDGYDRKRVVPKIRFFAGRLMYIGALHDLEVLSASLSKYAELKMLAEIMMSVVTRDVTRLLPLGTNAVQSAAQILKISADQVVCNIDNWDQASLQGLAVLRINGVCIEGPLVDDLNKFSVWHTAGDDLMAEGTDPVIRELACLHGISDAGRHEDILQSTFDWGENFALDGINQSSASDY